MIMMIFVTTTDSLTDEKLYEKAYLLIPEYRRVKADKMKMRENKLQTVTAGLLLNYAVGEWSIKTGEKDYNTDEILYETVDIISVIEANNPYFNYEIAYNSDWLDLEQGFMSESPRFPDISEAEWIKECDSDQRFFRIWTLKEAYGKATGQGVLDILDKIVYRLEKGKMKAYMCGLPQNFTIVEKEFDGFSLSVIQL